MYEESEESGEEKFSLVHKSLEAEVDYCGADGHKLTMLGLDCVDYPPKNRPSMKQIIRSLHKLNVVKKHADFLGFNNKKKKPSTFDKQSVNKPGKRVRNHSSLFRDTCTSPRRRNRGTIEYTEEMEPLNIEKITYKRLVKYTDSFSESNFIGHFQFGKLYRGELEGLPNPEYVMVKIWEVPEIYHYKHGDNELRLSDEVNLYRHEALINHPGMIKLIGYCWDDKHLCALYDFKPFDTVFNLIPKDGFTWLQRIKAALGLATVVKFLHTGKSSYKPIIIHNLDARHIVLDEEYNPKLCDLGSISGGLRPTYKGKRVLGCYGYIENVGESVQGEIEWSNKGDVFAFGVILIGLISKRVYTEEDKKAGAPFVYQWAWTKQSEDEKGELFSLVHKSLADEDPDFVPADGNKITALALQCINRVENERPTMKHVVCSLLKLDVVRQNAHFLGLDDEILRRYRNETS